MLWEASQKDTSTQCRTFADCQEGSSRVSFTQIKQIHCGCCCVPPSPLPTVLHLLIFSSLPEREGCGHRIIEKKQKTACSHIPPNVSAIKYDPMTFSKTQQGQKNAGFVCFIIFSLSTVEGCHYSLPFSQKNLTK